MPANVILSIIPARKNDTYPPARNCIQVRVPRKSAGGGGVGGMFRPIGCSHGGKRYRERMMNAGVIA
jgi:hypothetical protein